MSIRVFRTPPKKKSFLSNLSVNTNLILLNIVCYIVFMGLLLLEIVPLDYIAIKPSNILQGKFLWTFLTSMFMHGGIFHLFANMFSLFFIGGLIEKIIGPKRYLWFYLLSGLAAAAFFVVVSWVMLAAGYSSDFNTFAVGASGALFALIGMLMFVTPNLPVYVMFIPIPIKMKYAAPGILIVLWLISAFGDIPIGNTAHLGGLIVGVGYGIYLRSKYKNKIQLISKRFS